MKRSLPCFLILMVSCAAAAAAGEPTTQKAAAEIDALLAAQWKAKNVTPNPPASDEVFLRRIYLDLAGRIPTADEALAFLSSQQPDRRAALIDKLLHQESYVSNFYNYWADVLRFKSHYVNRANVIEAAYGKYIKQSLRENKPYDQFVREMLSAKGYAWDNGAIGYYHRDPEMPLDNMAITSRIFLGTRIECAQCHDHPFDKWKQTDFYHLSAYTYGNLPLNHAFDAERNAMRAREQVIDAQYKAERAGATDGGKAAAARKQERIAALDNRGVADIVRGCVGQLFSPIGLERDAHKLLKLPHDFKADDGKPGDVMKPAPLMGPQAEVAPGQDPAEVFATWVTSPENPRFTRVIVNRLWKKMFGLALTDPLDEIKDKSVASVPELEAYLQKLLVAQKYDMRAFLAVLANTRAYQSEVSRDEITPGTEYYFPGPLLRRMTAEQIWDSTVALASYEPDARDLRREAQEDRRIQISRMALEAYVSFDGEALLQLALDHLSSEKERIKRENVIREEIVKAKRQGDTAKARELSHQEGAMDAERGRTLVRDFIMPMLENLARQKAGKDARPVIDAAYKMNANPRVMPTETWRAMYIPGYGPPPKTPAQLEADAVSAKQRLIDLAAKLGYAQESRAGFVAYCEKAQAEWVRASELESPAPRGHFLRTMGQSDRDFVENANTTAAIPQALALMNGELISDKELLSPYSPLMHFLSQAQTSEARVNAAYLAILARKPTAAELSAWSKASGAGLTSSADLVYALLNTKQFIFIQ